jgi:predicted DNA-binding protein
MSKRIQVIISEDLDEKLTDFSTRYGVSKSSIVGFAVGQWMDRMEKFLDEREVSNLDQ